MLLGGGVEATVILLEDSCHLYVARDDVEYDVNRFQFSCALSSWWSWPCKMPLRYASCFAENTQEWWTWGATLLPEALRSHPTAGRAKLSEALPGLNLLWLFFVSSPPFGRSKPSVLSPPWCRSSMTIMTFLFVDIYLFSVNVCACACAHVCHCTGVKVRRWLGRVGSPLLTCKLQGLNSAHQGLAASSFIHWTISIAHLTQSNFCITQDGVLPWLNSFLKL